MPVTPPFFWVLRVRAPINTMRKDTITNKVTNEKPNYRGLEMCITIQLCFVILWQYWNKNLKKHPPHSIGSPRKIPSSSAFKRNKEQTCGCTTIHSLNVFLVPFVALIDEWQSRNIKEWKGGRGDTDTKKTRQTSKVTIKVEKESALSLFGRSDQEEAECKRKGGRWVFWSSLLDH